MLLIVSPTRELAQQIAAEANQLSTFHRFNIATFVGGTSMGKDLAAIRSTLDIVIATPGRLIQHLEESAGFSENCKGVSCLILDEADRLLDMVC